MIRCKRVYEPIDAADGERVLVDRLWPRGCKKESLALSVWLKEVAPSDTLRKGFCHDPALLTSFACSTAASWQPIPSTGRACWPWRSAAR
jgi:uncharacterized protein YeaO (DUF488 family)